LEGKVVEAGLGSGLNGGLSPSVVPFEGAGGLGLGEAGDGCGENGGQDLNFHGFEELLSEVCELSLGRIERR
jgi:hypothetical protein